MFSGNLPYNLQLLRVPQYSYHIKGSKVSESRRIWDSIKHCFNFGRVGGITVAQVSLWFANKRARTLAKAKKEEKKEKQELKAAVAVNLQTTSVVQTQPALATSVNQPSSISQTTASCSSYSGQCDWLQMQINGQQSATWSPAPQYPHFSMPSNPFSSINYPYYPNQSFTFPSNPQESKYETHSSQNGTDTSNMNNAYNATNSSSSHAHNLPTSTSIPLKAYPSIIEHGGPSNEMKTATASKAKGMSNFVANFGLNTNQSSNIFCTNDSNDNRVGRDSLQTS